MSRIKKYINYQFPGCEIGPRTSYWTRELVGMDPLFLVGPDLNPIEYVKMRRLVDETVEDKAIKKRMKFLVNY